MSLYPSATLYPSAGAVGVSDEATNLVSIMGGSQLEDFPKMTLGA